MDRAELQVVTATIVLTGSVDEELLADDPWSVIRAAVLAEGKIGNKGLAVTFVSAQLGLSGEARALGADLPGLSDDAAAAPANTEGTKHSV
jgi:hypothetical protein